MKKILVLGAGKGQLPLIEICKQKGYETVVVSTPGNYKGIELADKFYPVSIKDREEVLRVAREEKVDAVLNQLDFGVPIVAYVCEQLGLPNISMETAIRFTNKYIMMTCAQEGGIEVPKFCGVRSLEEALTQEKQFTYPYVIKPADCSASSGVVKIENHGMLLDHFQDSLSHSKDGMLIMEEYVSGQEYIVDSFTVNHQCYPMVLGQSRYFALEDKFIPKSRVFESAQHVTNEVGKRVIDLNNRLVKTLGLNFGITHGEFIYNAETDKVYMIEIAARGGGVWIASDIVPLVTGVNINALLLDYLLGEEICGDQLYGQNRAAGYFCFLLPEGTVSHVGSMEKVKKVAHRCEMDNLKAGKIIGALDNKGSRFGPVILDGETVEDVYSQWEQVKQMIEVYVGTEEGERGILWD